MKDNISMNEFFGWHHHPFSDTCRLNQPYLTEMDQRLIRHTTALLAHGKSMAVTGESGTGKSTLVQHIINTLDANIYLPVLIGYGGLKRGAILRAVADALTVDVTGRSMPLLVKLQKHILQITAQANPLYPVIVIDDAQLLERESFMDLCSLLIHPDRKTVAASLILIGDLTLAKTLSLQVMTPIRSRMTAVVQLKSLSENQSRNFIAFRLKSAKADENLFDPDALSIVTAHCRGNRRTIMNVATVLLEEAHFRQEKTVGSQLIFSCDLIDISE